MSRGRHVRVRGMHRRTAGRRRPLAGLIASITTGIMVVTAGVDASAASFVDTEYVRADRVAALDCTAPDVVDAHAWGRVLSARLLEHSLDPLAITDGITVDNVAPSTSSMGTSAAGTATALGGDAWQAALDLGLLSVLPIGVGLALPLDTGTGVYTQYGRAVADGQMTGAAGAVTAQAGGLVSLDTPTSETPRLGTLRLSELIDSILPALGQPVGSLSDVSLEIGAVGSVAEFAGCDALWNPAREADALDRDYLVANLDLGLTSDAVSAIGITLASTLDDLQTTLNTTLNSDVEGALVDTVTGLLGGILGGLAGIGLGDQPITVALNGSIDLQPVKNLLLDDLSDGVVTINLAAGTIRADLAALVGEAYGDSDGLNGRAPNTSVLTPEVINALLARVGTLLERFVVEQIEPKILETIHATEVSLDIAAKVSLTVKPVLLPAVTIANIADLTIAIDAPIGGLLGEPGFAPPRVDVDLELVPDAGPLISAVAGLVTALVSGLVGPLLDAVVGTLVPQLGTALIAPLLDVLTGIVSVTLASVVAGTLPPLVEALRPVLELLAVILKLTLNAQPDRPGSVGAPFVGAAGRYFVSALHVHVLGVDESLLDLWAASSSVGPARAR